MQLFSGGKDGVLFRGNSQNISGGTKMLQIESFHEMMESRLCNLDVGFKVHILFPWHAFIFLPFFAVFELIALLGPVPKALYKVSVVIVHWGLECLQDYHLNKVPFVLVSPATKMMLHAKLHVDFISCKRLIVKYCVLKQFSQLFSKQSSLHKSRRHHITFKLYDILS